MLPRLPRLLAALWAPLLGSCALQPAQPEPGAGVLAAEYAEVREYLAPRIEAIRERYGIAGLSIALVDEGRLVWGEGFGWARREAGVPATVDTVYRAGSLAKPLTAVGVLKLADAGRLDIDQPLADYLPGLQVGSRYGGAGAALTVRSVLSHHSGLPTDIAKGMWTDAPFTRLRARLAGEQLAFPPGLVFSYSNVGYGLLGAMIQEVTGEPFSGYMTRAVLAPMGMRASSFEETPATAARLATGYRDGRPEARLPIRDRPAFGLYTSARDLVQMVRLVNRNGEVDGRRVLAAGTSREMLAVQNAEVALDADMRRGLCWFLEQDSILGGGYVVRHGGTTLLYASELIALPEQRLGVVVLANSHGARPVVSRLAEEILHHVLDAREGERFAPSGDLLAEMPHEGSEGDPIPPGGAFTTELGLLTIARENRSWCASLGSHKLDLVSLPEGWLRLSEQAADSLPGPLRKLGDMRLGARAIDGREVILARLDSQRMLLGEKLPGAPISAPWQSRLGAYRVINPDPGFPVDAVALAMEGGHLSLRYRMPLIDRRTVRLPLQPVDDHQARVLGLGRARGESVRFEVRDGVPVLHYSGYLAVPTGD